MILQKGSGIAIILMLAKKIIFKLAEVKWGLRSYDDVMRGRGLLKCCRLTI